MPTTITQPEQEHIERLGEAFKEPSPQERFESWATRAVVEMKKEESEERKSARVREVKLAGLDDEERKFFESVAQKPEQQGENAGGRESSAAEESRGKNWAERHAAHRAEEKESKAAPSQAVNHRPKEQIRADIVAGRNPMFESSLDAALAKVPNPEAVLRYLDANPHLVEGLRNAKDSNELLSYVGQASARESMGEVLKQAAVKHPDAETKIRSATFNIMSKDTPPFIQHMVNDSEHIGELLYTLADQKTLTNLLNTARSNPGKAVRVLRDMELDIKRALSNEKAPAPKPRAPRPPGQVGDGAHTTDDGTRGESDFTNFSSRMSQRYARGR